MITLQPEDKMNATRQRDGSFSVVLDLKHADGDRRIVGNVPDPDAFYERCRAMMDAPVPQEEKEAMKQALVDQKAALEAQITEIDAELAVKEPLLKEM